MTLKCLLLKDAAESSRQLAGFIEQTRALTLEASPSSLKETIRLIDSSSPDIVFVNARQYAHIKNELADKDRSPAFIGLTHDDEHVNSHPLYTPLPVNGKPLSYTDFLDAVNTAMMQILGARAENSYKDERYFFIKSEYRILKINYDDIIFCEGLKDYTQVYTTRKAKPIITLQNLKTFSERLPPRNFVRIHRSYIVSLNHIESITKKEVEISDKILPIGNSYRNNLLDIVKRHS